MADLFDAGSNANGIPTSPPQIPVPAPTSSPRAGIRGPRVIMKERQEREARRVEQERMEKAQAEQDARILAERRAAERERAERAALAAAATAASSTNPMSNVPMDPATQRRQQRAERTAAASSGQPMPQQIPQQQQPPPQQPIPSQPQPTHQRHGRLPSGASQHGAAQAPSYNVPAQTSDAQAGAPGQTQTQAQAQSGQPGELGLSSGSRPRNSFPHAFERWEALSAHWEGLTSFWIRQLQQRTDEIDQDPLSRQLARQVTDLSAAGANLFHAVVELQRLRASSERKFQRWFFEMRSDMERNTEVQAMLEAKLQEERREREQAIQDALENERSNSRVQKQLAEMRKELAISKDEARRAWEELGRREQEERDRLVSLQAGQPTIVGGVQVVPMTQGLPMRQRASSSASQAPAPQAAQKQQQTQPQSPPRQQQQQQQQPQQQPQQPQHQEHHSALEELPSQAQQHYQPTPSSTQPPYTQAPTTTAGPSTTLSAIDADEAYEEEYGSPSTLSAPGSTYPPSASQQQYQTAVSPADYSGQGFAAPWETVPRHQHPTRLSDVIEEDDERSRTSASQLSRADRP